MLTHVKGKSLMCTVLKEATVPSCNIIKAPYTITQRADKLGHTSRCRDSVHTLENVYLHVKPPVIPLF